MEATIESSGLVLYGVAVPFHQETVVLGVSAHGNQVVHREVFDERSIDGIGALYGKPLLLNHDPGRPTGRIRATTSTPRGLEITADLIAGDDELEGLRRRVSAGVQSGLSIGFQVNSRADEWSAPTVRGELPIVLRRRVQIREISIVVWPAYEGATVTSVRTQAAVDAQRHLESQAFIKDTLRSLAESKELLARLPGRRK